MRKVNTAGFGARAWRVLRLALLWARKGGAFLDLRLALKPAGRRSVRDCLRYGGGEREFSFDETPTFRLKTPSARWQLLLPRIIPCIAPPAADHHQFDDGGLRFIGYGDAESRDHEEEYDDDYDHDHDRDHENDENGLECEIDLRAEEFIARFYQEIKLQRQRSWIQYMQ